MSHKEMPVQGPGLPVLRSCRAVPPRGGSAMKQVGGSCKEWKAPAEARHLSPKGRCPDIAAGAVNGKRKRGSDGSVTSCAGNQSPNASSQSQGAAGANKDKDGEHGQSSANATVTLQQLMRMGTFEDRTVELRDGSGRVLLRGEVKQGAIQCPGEGGRRMSCAEFESRGCSLATDGDNGAYMHLANGTSIRDFVSAVNNGILDAHTMHKKAQKDAFRQGVGNQDEGDGDGAGEVGGTGNATSNQSALGDTPTPQAPEAENSSSAQRKKPKRARSIYGQALQRCHVVKEGDKLAYWTSKGGIALRGYLTGTDVHCACGCGREMSFSRFEGHAGFGGRRQALDNIVHEPTGKRLKELAKEALGMDPTATASGRGSSENGKQRGGLAPLDRLIQEEGMNGLRERCKHILRELDGMSGGCMVCKCPDFATSGFTHQTMLLCDACEREYHIGCLSFTMDTIPEGEWFCSQKCREAHEHIRALAQRREASSVTGHPSCSIELASGRIGGSAIEEGLQILQEGFTPVRESATGTDLLPLMVWAESLGPHDFTNMHVALLRFQGEAVVAATVRVFGDEFAEVPLISTRASARGRGFPGAFLQGLADLLGPVGVRTVILPAERHVERMWIERYGFARLSEREFSRLRSEVHLVTFPGATMLCRDLK